MPMIMSIPSNLLKRCSRCKSSDDMFEDRRSGDVVCTNCGFVVCGRIIDETDEFVAYAEDDRSRGDQSRSESSVGGVWSDMVVIKGGSTEKSNALLKSHLQCEDRNKMKALDSLEKVSVVCSALNLTKQISDCAASYFVQAITEGFYKKSDKSILAATVVYLACRIDGYPRTMNEVSAVTGVAVKQIGKLQLELTRNLKLEVVRVNPEALVSRSASHLHLGAAFTEHARQTCCKVVESGQLDGTAPHITAAAAVLLAFTAHKVNKSSSQISGLNALIGKNVVKILAEASSTTVVTLRNAFIVIAQFSASLLPPKLVSSDLKIADLVACLDEGECSPRSLTAGISHHSSVDMVAFSSLETNPLPCPVTDSKAVPQSMNLSRSGRAPPSERGASNTRRASAPPNFFMPKKLGLPPDNGTSSKKSKRSLELDSIVGSVASGLGVRKRSRNCEQHSDGDIEFDRDTLDLLLSSCTIPS